MSDFIAVAHAVRARLGQRHRYVHSVNVARLAGKLAHAHGEDSRRARLAGILHDVARLYDPRRLIDECAARHLEIDDFEREHPVVLHARVGAEIAREEFGIEDEGVLDAIRRHTVAAKDMSRLDTIVYVADALEPGRDYAARAKLERLAFADLEDAAIAVIRSSIAYLTSKNLVVAPPTLAALATYEKHKENLLCRT